ncbi:hypothetical protein PNQ29_03270 [Halobacterium salinarum]|uniref:hypothetical protein n=1 Tax=Halobacterium salinarum TaxID=2242 RepID=UPI0025541A2D|nr:hypothetical protein [Halobacterium salinarum]MDL0118511.1 hypothetical protein [Halobacterium salinarum]MDL0118724.1 hypothetical protein [Halobacterium salinarum]MDL0118764.1 hypothetical protein [Halobacterium salinarum]
MTEADGEERLCDRMAALERQLAAVQTELQTTTNHDLPLLKGTLRSLLDVDGESVAEFPAAGHTLGQQIAEYEQRLEQLEARLDVLDQHRDASTKAEKIASVLAFAQNKADSDGKVAVTPAEIRGCTGVSRRYAYDLVDAIADDVEGVQIREGHQVQTGSGIERKSKALLVDCERVHELNESVNQFTTPNGGEATH